MKIQVVKKQANVMCEMYVSIRTKYGAAQGENAEYKSRTYNFLCSWKKAHEI